MIYFAPLRQVNFLAFNRCVKILTSLMFSSNLLKIIFLSVVLFAPACSFFQSKPDADAPQPTPFVAEELKSAIPFSTKEPNIYQTEIVVTANQVEDKFFTARNGENRLAIYNYQTKSEISVLQIGDDRTFTIAPNRKIYAEKETGVKGETADDFFTAEWLNQKTDAKFETLSPENNLARYRVNLDGAANSEIIIYVDAQIGLPVKQEFYSLKDEQRILTITMELRNFNAQTDAKFFEVPKDYRKVSSKEFYETTRANQIKK